MPVLTQRERAGAVSQKALKDGLISGGLTLIPSYGAVWLAMKRSPQFLKVSLGQNACINHCCVASTRSHFLREPPFQTGTLSPRTGSRAPRSS